MPIIIIFFIVVSLLLPEPTYSGPENVVYFRSLTTLEETLKENKQQTVWFVCFYTVWNPTCANFAPIFSQLSVKYAFCILKNHLNYNVQYGWVLYTFSLIGSKKFWVKHVDDGVLAKLYSTNSKFWKINILVNWYYGKDYFRKNTD